jgi:hypothetical protein
MGGPVSVLYDKPPDRTRPTIWFRCNSSPVCSRRGCGLNRMEMGEHRKPMETFPEPPLLHQAVETSLHVKGLSLLNRRFVPHRGSVRHMWYDVYALVHFNCSEASTAVDPGRRHLTSPRRWSGLQWRNVDRKFRKRRSSFSKVELDPSQHTYALAIL